ncbi:MAG: tRNA preQ1(34) S-adenosylmethionine ribosyltransferase-isomerase QueA, partial [Desulfobacteraceae bacterium]
NTKVVPARLKGKKETGGRVEVLILDYASRFAEFKTKGVFTCDCLVRASRAPKVGSFLFLGDALKARVENSDNGILTLRFIFNGDISEIIKKIGDIPLPPYIKRQNQISEPEDRTNYQTVFASKEGAVAAPTAGLHFTGALMDDLAASGIEFAEITLHVGYGTFVPVRVDDIRDHRIHSEFYSVSKAAADRVTLARQQGRRVVAVGTTAVRTLEYLSGDNGHMAWGSGMCDLFIYPGYKFKCVDAIVTNFHLPESTLLMLVSAFAGRETVLSAYEAAIREKYRFFSYGDAMFFE